MCFKTHVPSTGSIALPWMLHGSDLTSASPNCDRPIVAELSLTDEQQRDLLERRILPVIFGDAHASPAPTLTVVTGQPGSGSPRATSRVLSDAPDSAVISTDTLQALHPRYPDLVRSRSPRALTLLSEPAAYWAAQALTHARETARSLIVETSISSPSTALRLAESFSRGGFAIRVIVVATPRAQSLLAAASGHLLERRAGRTSTPPALSAHDESWNAVRALVGGLEATPAVDQLSLFDDAGTVLFDAARADERAFAGASRTLIAAHSTPMTNASAMRWLSELRAATDYAITDDSLDRSTVDVLLELQGIAVEEVLPRIVLPPESLARANASVAIAERADRLRRAAGPSLVDAAAPSITAPDVTIGLSR